MAINRTQANKGSRVVSGSGSLGNGNVHVQNLDIARCSGKWSDVNELANKVIKLAPAYGSLAQVAQVEAQLVSFLRTKSPRQDELLVGPKEGTQLAEKLKGVGAGLPSFTEGTVPGAVEYNFIQNVVAAHIQLVQGNYSDVIRTLGSFPIPSNPTLGYTRVSAFKAKTILGSAFEALGDVDNGILTYKDPLPASTTPEGVAWCEVLYYKFASLVTSELGAKAQANDSNLTLYALRQYSNNSGKSYEPVGDLNTKLSFHQLFLDHASNELAKDPSNVQLQNEVRQISSSYENTLFNSTKTGDIAVENYLRILMKNWRSVTDTTIPRGIIIDENQINYSKHVFEVLKKAACSTFHSARVMRYHIEVLGTLGQYSEALAAFNTYSAYQDKDRIRTESGGGGGRRGDSIKGVCDAFYRAIRIAIHINRDRVKGKEFADGLSKWLPKIGTDDTRSVPREILAKAYGAIADAYAYYSKATFSDDDHYKSIIDTAINNYEQSLESSPNTDITYNYALLLAQTADISKSIEIVKSGLVQNNKHFPSWHLLALLLTNQEDYDVANKVLNSAIELGLEENSRGTLGGIEVKGCIIQMKLTQLAIIETTTNAETVLEYLPETLTLYGKLFPGATISSFQTSKETTEPAHSSLPNSHTLKPRPRRSMGLRLSHDRSKQPTPTPNGHRKSNLSSVKSDIENERLSKPSNVLQQQLFQDVWLYIAAIYRRNKMTRDAEESIVEAEHMYRESADTQVELGQLMAKDRPLHALQQFEAALDENGDHLKATLSLAQLILAHSRIGETETTPSSPFEFFISHKDELAAHARLQSLLETQVTKYPGRYSSQAWYFLGCIYEKSAQIKNAEHALWQSVELEEVHGVRDYSVSRYYFR